MESEFERLRRNWERLGAADPLWAVLTDPSKAGGRWRDEDFFDTGVLFCRWLGDWIAACGQPVPGGRALDFGCGVGRLTQAMAPYFDRVTGVDISKSMLEAARQRNRFPDRVDYVCNARPDLSAFADGAFDYAQAVLVLQHMRPEYARGYLRELLRVLRPGGLLFAQAAIAPRDPSLVYRGSEAEHHDEMRIEMHPLPPESANAVFAAGGGQVVGHGGNELAGPDWHSAHWLVRKV